ncbi:MULTISPECIES: glycosyltransferase [unclassified Psychrobacter]|uniref:glycosyltransferase n=1 Tax=unclassified Psychrobacter TaxID=196806 RepID=UPI0011EE8C70|nr:MULTISPECIES: glycosyltransferase [unclassified Psychrobacter]KAA0939943.1 glycosyltransferase family 4 protein [Psychrobacter sp. ANT_H59]WAI88230.1 Putative glycosyltransferase EpsD [Psychrobacter sp. SC65A.3]
MKVMRLLSSLKHDESERGIFHLGRALVKNEHTSIIISSANEDNDLVRRLKRDGNHYHQLYMNKKSWLSLLQVAPLRRLIEKYDPDIIHVHSRTPAWVLHLALRRARVKRRPKLVSTMYGFYPINKYSQALLDVHTIITVSDSVTDYLKKGLRREELDPRVIKRIYRGVDTRRYPYRHNPSVYWLRHTFAEYPELENKKWLVFPTIIGKEYGQEWLIDILGNLQEQFPNIHAIIMDDDYRAGDVAHEDFRQRSNTLGLADRITYVGSKRNDMREWLSAANVVMALANQPESIGINALQAIHLGTPVIGWDQAAFSEILRPLYPQGLVRKYNANALCKAVRNQLESVTRPEMTNKFTMREMIDETIGVYKNLHEQALAEEKAAADALAVRRHKKVFGVTSEPIINKKTANKVRLVKDKPNTSYSTKVTEEPNDA